MAASCRTAAGAEAAQRCRAGTKAAGDSVASRSALLAVLPAMRLYREERSRESSTSTGNMPGCISPPLPLVLPLLVLPLLRFPDRAAAAASSCSNRKGCRVGWRAKKSAAVGARLAVTVPCGQQEVAGQGKAWEAHERLVA